MEMLSNAVVIVDLSSTTTRIFTSLKEGSEFLREYLPDQPVCHEEKHEMLTDLLDNYILSDATYEKLYNHLL